MKTHLKSYCLSCALLLGLSTSTLNAQLLTITAGAVSTNVGAKLKFVNGTNFTTDAGFIQLTPYTRIANRYGTNFTYGTSNLLFQALSVKTNPTTSAAFGSYIVCQIMSVTGPAGGIFSFWEQGAGWPTYQFPVNGLYATGKNRFVLSNVETGAGRPDGDPFGNIRGRRFAVNKAGEYLVTFRLYDASKNHPAMDGPIHLPSDTLTVKFKTSVDMDITQLRVSNNVAMLTFKQGWLTNMVVESTTNLGASNWVVVSGPFTTTPTLTTNLFTNTLATGSLFYRLRGVTP